MPKERKTITKPMMAKESDLRAESTCFGSPPPVTNFIADIIMKKIATMPANAIAAITILLKIVGRHPSVGTPLSLSRQLVQSIIYD